MMTLIAIKVAPGGCVNRNTGIVPPWLEQDGYERTLPDVVKRVETATRLAAAITTEQWKR